MCACATLEKPLHLIAEGSYTDLATRRTVVVTHCPSQPMPSSRWLAFEAMLTPSTRFNPKGIWDPVRECMNWGAGRINEGGGYL